MNRLFASTALAAALAVTPALAQQYGDQPQGTDPLLQQQETAPQDSETILEKQPQDQMPQNEAAQQQPMESQEVEFIASQEQSDWLASSLIGRSVFNTEQQTLGDISDVILNEDGQVVAVLIGVGGFLGIGGKDVGVNFAALQFEERKDVEPAPSAPPQAGGGLSTPPMANTEPPRAPGQAPGSLTNSEPQAAEAEDDADHSNMIIVLNVTKEELAAAPAFVPIGEEPSSETSEPAAQSPEPSPSQTQ